jgi:hypothetical protein
MELQRATCTGPLFAPAVSPTHSATPPIEPDLAIATTEHDPYELIRPEWVADLHRPFSPTDTETSFRHSHWTKARERTRRAMVDAGLPLARRFRFQCCGGGARVKVDALSGQVRIYAQCCHDRWCRACGHTRRQKLARALSGALGKRKAMHVVLTPISTSRPLAEQLDKLIADFGRLRRTKWWRYRAAGGAWVFEVTWNATTEQWHPHLHVLVHASYLDLRELSALWYKTTGDSHRVHVSLVRHGPSAITELTKYVGKITHRSWEHDHVRLVEAMRALAGRRLANTFGTWTGTELQPHDDDPTVREWIHWGSVDELFALASSGDADAIAIRTALATGQPVDLETVDFSSANRERCKSQAAPAP